ncbi:hypothetical protein [Streptomyces sp. NPDC017941]|uniref:hypothetical protein n=1 Tax=Streptomyces sp. NPDC017941 TaxID=3365018 RepID=UPI0037B032C8
MDRTAIQHAGIAGEAVNGVNKRIHAALTHAEGADMKRLKDAYEVVASLKLLSQRLTLSMDQLAQLVSEWHDEGHLHTAPAIDVNATVADVNRALNSASERARALFIDLDDVTKSLAPIGWKDPI